MHKITLKFLMKSVKFILIFYLISSLLYTKAQPPKLVIPPIRQLPHYNLDKVQKQLLALDGKPDNQLTAGNNEEINLQLTYTATVKIDALQNQIETDTSLSNTQKITYLRGLAEALTEFINLRNRKVMKLVELPETIKQWEAAFIADKKNKSIETIVYNTSSSIGSVLLKGIAFSNNTGFKQAKDLRILKYIEENPTRVLQILSEYPDVFFADSLIVIAAKKEPENLFDYAQAVTSKFGKRIQHNTDPTVRLLCSLANESDGQLLFPFYDNLSKGLITADQIRKEMKDTLSYYRLLVKTQIDYAGRLQKGDTPTGLSHIKDMIHKRAYDSYVNVINGLHDQSNESIRFKAIENLTPQELYHLIISCETEIYTSSYINVYKRIWQRMKVPSADSLLISVNSDHYKKFITMAANYNTLDDFLGRMSKEHATALMINFVNNLENGENVDDLEDAVDVANSYASIKNDTIKKIMLNQIEKNYEMAKPNGNKRAQTIYHLEKLILSSSDPTKNINLTDSLGILPIYDIKNQFLRDSLGRIVLQMYFYGDKSGMGSFEVLKRLYTNKNWKITSTPEWIQINSVNAKIPFVIFANRALDEMQSLDAQAQEHLNKWMTKNGYEPSITVHRGHSYYLNETIKQLSPSNKIIILGSCGAYHSIRAISNICPEAHLIASKQTGFGEINIALFTTLIDDLKNGSDINWPSYWKRLEKSIQNQEGFDDYIPPYKNLGAIFITAYKKQLETN